MHRLAHSNQVFIQLGISPETAAADACKVEHDLSDETFEKIKAHAAGGRVLTLTVSGSKLKPISRLDFTNHVLEEARQ